MKTGYLKGVEQIQQRKDIDYKKMLHHISEIFNRNI
jgi:hypothetical protein